MYIFSCQFYILKPIDFAQTYCFTIFTQILAKCHDIGSLWCILVVFHQANVRAIRASSHRILTPSILKFELIIFDSICPRFGVQICKTHIIGPTLATHLAWEFNANGKEFYLPFQLHFKLENFMSMKSKWRFQSQRCNYSMESCP